MMNISTLRPQADPMVASRPLYGVEETNPFWIRASEFDWQVSAGQIVIPSPAGIVFVRQEETS
jgi:hypothetical protein